MDVAHIGAPAHFMGCVLVGCAAANVLLIDLGRAALHRGRMRHTHIGRWQTHMAKAWNVIRIANRTSLWVMVAGSGMRGGE